MKENEKIINEVLNSCLTGYSIYEDDIVECITKENRSLIRGLTRQEQLKLLCDVITMAYTKGQENRQEKKESAPTVTEPPDEDDKVRFNNLIGRDMYRQMKAMNRRQFTDFLFDLYKNIFEDREKESELNYENIRTEVMKINGIGNVKADAIVDAMKRCLNKEGDS